MNDDNVKPSPQPSESANLAPTGPDVCDRILNVLRGAPLNVALEGTAMAMCELARAAANGDTNAAAVQIIENTIRFYDAFPQSIITGMSLVDTGPAGSTVQ